MEPMAVVDMIEALHNKFTCSVKCLAADDDSTMKANCCWSDVDHKRHCGVTFLGFPTKATR